MVFMVGIGSAPNLSDDARRRTPDAAPSPISVPVDQVEERRQPVRQARIRGDQSCREILRRRGLYPAAIPDLYRGEPLVRSSARQTQGSVELRHIGDRP
jgi:hypothetical protein